MFDKDKYIQFYNITNTNEILYLEMYLSYCQKYLKRHGLTLVSGTETMESVPSFSVSQTLWYLPYRIATENINLVQVKRHGELETITDYTLFGRIDTDINSYKKIEFENNYAEIQVTGFFGFATFLPEDLEFAFFNLFGELFAIIKKQTEILENGGKDLNSLKIDEISYKFNNSNVSITKLSYILDNSKDLKKIVSSYV